MSQKKIPQRMCVSCREMKAKKDLLRVVKCSNGDIIVDETGKLSGRGAYICKELTCFDKCRKTKALERAFQCTISDDTFSTIKEKISG